MIDLRGSSVTPEAWALDIVFGPGEGNTVEARAQKSPRVFVRSLDQLGEDRPRATGRRLTALEALDAYGFDKLLEVASEGSAAVARSADAAGLPLKTQRIALGLDEGTVARRANVAIEEVLACEASRRLPLRTYERIGRALGLDERFIAVTRHPRGNAQLTVRLRAVGEDSGILDRNSVSALAEAAWVAATQGRLADSLALGCNRRGLVRNPNFSTPGYPAYRWGYRLAIEARDALGLSQGAPVASLRDVVEEQFGIPLIQCNLGEAIAGATVEAGSHRAIIVNRSGANSSVYTRRMTIAHELGHLLFDPPDVLDVLRVDEYDELERSIEQIADPVEQRANAFAVEFLAPRDAILVHFEHHRDLFATVGRFGIGATAARHQIRNASKGGVSADDKRIPSRGSDEWRQFASWDGAESFALDFHPIPHIRPSRAGRFGALVLRGAEECLISWDTAAEWLETTEETLRGAADIFHELFPGVWP